MERETPTSWHLGCVGFALCTLGFVAAMNQHTPFRGEHWALIEYVLNGSSFWDQVQRVSHFVCFSDKRFQPLAFFPTMGSYLLFGTHFVDHYLLSIGLHLVLTYCFLKLLSVLRREIEPDRRNLFVRYPLEASLFLVLYPFVDLMTWSFYHYVQWALLLGAISVACFIEGIFSDSRKESVAVGLALIATLIYEPFLSYLFVYFLVGLVRQIKKKGKFPWAATFCLAVLVPIYYAQFSTYVAKVASYSDKQLSMVTAPIPIKLFYLVHKIALLGFNGLWSSMTFVLASKRETYEYALPKVIAPYLIERDTFLYLPDSLLSLVSIAMLVGVSFLGYLFYRRWRTHPRTLAVSAIYFMCMLGPVLLVAWGRPVIRSISVSLQFRYFTLMAVFGLIFVVEGLRYLAGRRIYESVLLLLIVINAFNAIAHGNLVRFDMQEVGAYVTQRLQSGLKGKSLVRSVDGALINLEIPVRQWSNAPFQYNAQKCIAEFTQAPVEPTARLHSLPSNALSETRALSADLILEWLIVAFGLGFLVDRVTRLFPRRWILRSQ